MTEHQALYKNQGKDSESLRKNRTDHALTLRREKHEDAMSKRRNISHSQDEEDGSSGDNLQELMTLEEAVLGIQSSDFQVQLRAVRNVRKLLAFNEDSPTEKLINMGILPILVNFLQSENTHLQVEAAWALTIIASESTEQTKAIVDSGAVPIFLKLLSSPAMSVCEQVIWALGNIARNGAHFRDYCIELGIATQLLNFVRSDIPLDFLRNVAWVLVNLCRYKTPPSSRELVQSLLQLLSELIQHTDTEVLIETLWAISHLLDAGDETIEMVLEANILPTLISFLGHNNDDRVQAAALQACVNITSGTDKQAQAVLDHGVLDFMPALLRHTKEKIKKDAVWLISNITSDNSNQIQTIINSGLMKYVIDLLSHSNFQIQREAAYTISNVASVGDSSQVLYLVRENYIPAACSLLLSSDTRLLQVILNTIQNTLLKLPDYTNELCQQIEECGGLNKIETLQTHESEYVHKKVFELIDEYFSHEDENI